MTNLLMKNGTEVQIRLTFKDLYELEKNNAKLAEEYFAVQQKDVLNELDMIKVIHIAYLCAGNKQLSFEQFLEEISQNRSNVMKAYYELIYPKN